jgi:hypothetical protein
MEAWRAVEGGAVGGDADVAEGTRGGQAGHLVAGDVAAAGTSGVGGEVAPAEVAVGGEVDPEQRSVSLLVGLDDDGVPRRQPPRGRRPQREIGRHVAVGAVGEVDDHQTDLRDPVGGAQVLGDADDPTAVG